MSISGITSTNCINGSTFYAHCTESCQNARIIDPSLEEDIFNLGWHDSITGYTFRFKVFVPFTHDLFIRATVVFENDILKVYKCSFGFEVVVCRSWLVRHGTFFHNCIFCNSFIIHSFFLFFIIISFGCFLSFTL